ncbi:CocE/NonD family hydrolase [Streptomyces sp. NPDC090088]|uniref:CocE/NonD family hydrolase n=1 Tax=Streptomyces sp. NPDC090088 TaxID=3365944 RepID=UPI00380A2310
MPLPVHRAEPAPVPDSATQVMVAMRDGARLATDLYLPSGHDDLPSGHDGRLPTALVRLPYDKNSRYVFMDRIAAYLTARGYAVVVQDVRGKFRSEGETVPFVHEADDGYDTIDWIVGQEWSDGRVGMFGDSYYGATQWAAVSAGHPALKAIAPRVTGADGIRPDYWERDGVTQLFGALYYAAYWTDRWVYEFEPDLSRRPLIEAMAEITEGIGARPAMWDSFVPEVRAVPAFPHGHPFDGPPLPVLHQAGWFDNCLQPSINDWAELSARPDWAPLQYLHADSIDHENYHLDDAPVPPELDHAHVDTAVDRLLPRHLDPLVEFFDVFVKGEGTPERLPRVRWHHGHLGDRTADSWPPVGARTLRLYPGGEGGLTADAPAREAAVSWVHDPADLVPSLVPDSFSALRDHVDESLLHDRADVLTFTADPVTEPLDLAGPVRATLTVGTDGPSAHVYLKLLDVSPGGAAHVLVRGQRLIPGGAPAPVTFDLTHTGYRLRPGHALRLHIASSDFPTYVPHPGTEENEWLAADGRTTTQTLRTGGEHDSHLSLTVVDLTGVDAASLS